MSECYEHEKLRRQGSPCPYCRIAELATDNTFLRVAALRADNIEKHRDELQAEIERLTADYKKLLAQHLGVLERIAKLEAELEEWKR